MLLRQHKANCGKFKFFYVSAKRSHLVMSILIGLLFLRYFYSPHLFGFYGSISIKNLLHISISRIYLVYILWPGIRELDSPGQYKIHNIYERLRCTETKYYISSRITILQGYTHIHTHRQKKKSIFFFIRWRVFLLWIPNLHLLIPCVMESGISWLSLGITILCVLCTLAVWVIMINI